MDAHQLYIRHAQPHLPSMPPYADALMETFCANAVALVEWVVDAGSALLGEEGSDAPFPIEAVTDHVLRNASVFQGSILTRIEPYDRLDKLVKNGDRTIFGPMMIGLMVLHLVRAADAVSVGIANASAKPGERVDVTSRARGMLTTMIAREATRKVQAAIGDRMSEMNDLAYRAAASWTRQTLH